MKSGFKRWLSVVWVPDAVLVDSRDNTLEFDKGEPTDHLTDVPTAVRWLQEHELLHREMVDPLLDQYHEDDTGGPVLSPFASQSGVRRPGS